MYVATDAHADEVLQETWVAVLRGIDGFEQRSSLKTRLYRIVMNIARTRGVKESCSIPFSSLRPTSDDPPTPHSAFTPFHHGAGRPAPGWSSRHRAVGMGDAITSCRLRCSRR
jgi:RNA polymerase sigma-70 factor, ECF subfamily